MWNTPMVSILKEVIYMLIINECCLKGFWDVALSDIGNWLGWFLGSCDGLLCALIVFVIIDYVTCVMCDVFDKKFSSADFKGICQKVLIFLLVGMANILEIQIIGTDGLLRTAVIAFYIACEGLLILENAVHLGLPIPQKMKEILAKLRDRSEGGK